MKEKITIFIHNLIIYDYVLFGGAFVLFILFVVLAILLREKVGFSIFLVLLSFSILFLVPTYGYIQLHKFLFKNSITISMQKKLTFTKAIVIKGSLSNESKFNFTTCKIVASAYKVTGNQFKDIVMRFKPIRKGSILEYNISKRDIREFKMFIEPFTYEKDYNLSVEANCK